MKKQQFGSFSNRFSKRPIKKIIWRCSKVQDIQDIQEKLTKTLSEGNTGETGNTALMESPKELCSEKEAINEKDHP